jgi:hypothetical protein
MVPDPPHTVADDTPVTDIRDGPPEEYWDRLRAMLGPEGLPPLHVVVSAEALAGGNGTGGRIGVRLTLVDEGSDRRVVAAGAAVYQIG